MEKNEIIKLLDDNYPTLVKMLVLELSELGLPFILDENNIPQVELENQGIVNNIYGGVCSKFIFKNKDK